MATRENVDALVRIALRARQHGYHLLVATRYNEDLVSTQLMTQLDATVIETEHATEDKLLSDVLPDEARVRGFPGLICHWRTSDYIDYDRTADQLRRSNRFAIDAATTQSRAIDRPQILVAIPAYNEERNITNVVEQALDYADDVVVVDDGSTDSTAKRARAAGATVVEHEHNRGYGATLQTAFEEASASRASVLVVLDGDGQHDAADVPSLVEPITDDDADVVIGSRFVDGTARNVPIYRRFGLFVINVLTNLSLGVVRRWSWVTDTQSGLRAYDSAVVESLANDPTLGDGMSASTDILYHAHHNDYDIEEVQATVRYDVEHESSSHPVAHGFTLVRNILKTVERERPMTVLGFPGFMGSVAGIVFFYWTFTNNLSTGSFPLGIALMSAFFTLAGIFSMFTGIILHSLNTNLDGVPEETWRR